MNAKPTPACQEVKLNGQVVGHIQPVADSGWRATLSDAARTPFLVKFGSCDRAYRAVLRLYESWGEQVGGEYQECVNCKFPTRMAR
ncbi:hypothetical protein [Magnetofaba australis]|uniref:hypothetical protein n=1 Tax=Magnetofaba australis TaxID=1472297 RepID=UPI000A19D950|nr:hypothetical protein [Magnetofaba australis]